MESTPQTPGERYAAPALSDRTDTTTPAGLGWEHGTFAAEAWTLEDNPPTLTDDEIAAYFPTADRTATLIAYRDAWSEAFQTFAEAVGARDLSR